MPELPEIEVLRTSLARDMVGRKFKSVNVTSGKVVSRHKTAKDFRTTLEGHTIKAVQRLGTNLIFALDNQTHLVMDLAKGGHLQRVQSAKDVKPKHTHVVFSFTQGNDLWFVDPKTEGDLYVATPPAEGVEVEISKFARLSVGGDGIALRKAIATLAPLGVDPFEDQIGWDRFAAILRSRSTVLKAVLTDPAIICSLGDIYADEILYTAGLHPARESEGLSTIEIRRLHRSIAEILADAVKHNGTTLADLPFEDPDGKPGAYQELLAVYGREGQPCLQCRAPIKKETIGGRPTNFCPKCQG